MVKALPTWMAVMGCVGEAWIQPSVTSALWHKLAKKMLRTRHISDIWLRGLRLSPATHVQFLLLLARILENKYL